jgi:protease-4
MILAATAASPARAQDPVAEVRPVTAGVDRPVHDYSGEGDASSLELNPAMLSAVEGIDLTLRGYTAVNEFMRGSGFGGWLSANAFGIAMGLGVQFLQPSFRDTYDFDSAANFDATKVSFGVSGGDPDYGSFGFSVSGIRRSGARIRQPDLDLGALVRMTNYASLGVTARLSPVDLAPNALRPETGLVGELAIRPLGTRHLELAGGVKARLDSTGEQLATEVYPRARAAVRFQGWSILGEVEQVPATVLEQTTLELQRRTRAWRGSVALNLSWDFVTVESGVRMGVSEGLDGVGYMARFSSTRQGRVYWPRQVTAERLDIAEIEDERSLISMLARIEAARRAGKRSVLVVDARDIDVGWASLEELRDGLIDVRNAGGHVFAYVERTGMKEYYLASVAEQVYIHPAGEVSIFGLSTTGFYLRDALARLGVKVEALHIAEYKSAHEMYSRADRSEADREQRTAVLEDTFDVFVTDVAQARKLSKSDVRGRVGAAPHGPEDAKSLGLVDEVVHRDEVLVKISERIGANVSFREVAPTRPEEPTWSNEPYIAVVMVEGTIVDGKGRSLPLLNISNAGGDTIADLIRETREDRACRGIILRVNSPGGSALASEIIWREVARTQEAHEDDPRSAPPIVVSMGDVAASGGYYVAMGAKKVFAQPSTITGSIGVVATHFDVSGLLRILGIATDTLKQGELADIGSLWRPYTKEERARLQQSMQRTYDLFRKRVADARGLSEDEVHELGRGHVYSGRDAKALKLVDEMGGLYDAVDWIRQQNQVGRRFELPLRVLPKKRRLIDLLLDDSGPIIQASAAKVRTRREQAREKALPLVLDEALARLPLSILFLPQDRPSAIMDAELRIE